MTGAVVAIRSRRRLLVVLAGLLVVAAAMGTVVVASGGSGPRPRRAPDTTGPDSVAAVARLHAIQRVVTARAAAVLHHDRAAFMATVDPQGGAFRRSEARIFANLAPVPLAAWSYAMTATPRRPPPDAARYGAPVWAPSHFALHYRLAGFDARPTDLPQYPTFVRRGGRWYLASLSDYATRGLISATDLWDYGPVQVLRRGNVLVLGAPSQQATMTQVAREAAAAIGQVTAVWGHGWSQRAVVLVPATTREMALIDDYHGDLAAIAALTSAEVSTAAGRPAPVGDRVTINPVAWPALSDIGAAVVIRHELTHVATRAVTGAQTPTWLSEGFADYVGFRVAPVSVGVAAASLRRLIAVKGLPGALPSTRDFRSTDPQLAAHYQAAWLACRYIAHRFGQATLVRFYRAVGTSSKQSPLALTSALRDVLHLRLASFVSRWRHYLRTELAS
ncbi:MAG TPA: hypothetical protein VG650_12885 [Mycobacteriales bacterium]|nr:hypothetical protein [Mycobacteriales bacterium]